MLYVDEAHAFGVCGPRGLGLVADSQAPGEVDVVIGTFGKAAGSMGAFAITSDAVRQYLVNTSRPLIFSTVIAADAGRLDPFRSLGAPFGRTPQGASSVAGRETQQGAPQVLCRADSGLAHTAADHRRLQKGCRTVAQIIAYIWPEGAAYTQAHRAAGTERLRISLSASLNGREIDELDRALADLLPVVNPDTKC